MKHIINHTLLSLCLVTMACSKSDDNDTDGLKDMNETIISYEGKWQVPSKQPMAPGQTSSIAESFRLKGKEYYYAHIFTGHQNYYNLCKYENDKFEGCIVAGPNQELAGATDHFLAKIVTELTTDKKSTIITTRIYDPLDPTTPLLSPVASHVQTVPYALHTTIMPTTQHDFYLITRLSGARTTLLWKWNSTANLWETDGESITEAEDWNSFEALKSHPDEFIVKVPIASDIHFYRYKNDQLEKLVTIGNSSINAEPHVYPYGGQYLAVAPDKVYKMTADGTLTPYYTPPERTIVASYLDRDKLFLCMGGFNEVVQRPIVHHVLMLDLSNGKVHRFPPEVDHTDSFGLFTLDMLRMVRIKGWSFKVNVDNQVEGILNLGHHQLPNVYRVVFPEKLK